MKKKKKNLRSTKKQKNSKLYCKGNKKEIKKNEIKHYNLKKKYHQCEKIIIIIHYYNFGINIFNKKN